MVDETVNILMTCIREPNTAPRRVAIDGPLILRGSTRNQKGKS
jgi:LacI family transcriptional regulator